MFHKVSFYQILSVLLVLAGSNNVHKIVADKGTTPPMKVNSGQVMGVRDQAYLENEDKAWMPMRGKFQ